MILQQQRQLTNVQTGRGTMPVPVPQQGRAVAGGEQPVPEPARNVGMFDNVGRNDPCPCGSGKKFKHCHYREIQAKRETVNPDAVKQRASTRRRRR